MYWKTSLGPDESQETGHGASGESLDRAATFLLGEARFLDAIIRAERNAHDVITLLHQKHGRDGGVYTAGHAEQNLGFCIGYLRFEI